MPITQIYTLAQAAQLGDNSVRLRCLSVCNCTTVRCWPVFVHVPRDKVSLSGLPRHTDQTSEVNSYSGRWNNGPTTTTHCGVINHEFFHLPWTRWTLGLLSMQTSATILLCLFQSSTVSLIFALCAESLGKEQSVSWRDERTRTRISLGSLIRITLCRSCVFAFFVCFVAQGDHALDSVS